jgi:Mrp family chromosome partitioning ATPase
VLPFGEAFSQALASDLIPVEPVAGNRPPANRAATIRSEKKTEIPPSKGRNEETVQAVVATEPSICEPNPAELPNTAQPVWEVDRFHWPRTCEKLLADSDGYLATAGEKLLAAVQDGLKVLAITGTRRGEGRSTLALCLARAAARTGIEVAVMDADFLRPQLASKLGLETAFGWQDAALGKIPLSEAAVKSLADGITVMPLESAPVTRRLSLADPRVTATVRAAAATFELLILDLGPSGPGQQVLFPRGESCPFDAAIVVRDLRFTAADEAEAVGEMLHAAGIEAVGVAENFVVDEEIPATSV